MQLQEPITLLTQDMPPGYLAEFCYRHNRRFQLEDMIPRFGNMAVRTSPMLGKLLKLDEAYG